MIGNASRSLDTAGRIIIHLINSQTNERRLRPFRGRCQCPMRL
jgi:hypothetical protein